MIDGTWTAAEDGNKVNYSELVSEIDVVASEVLKAEGRSIYSASV